MIWGLGFVVTRVAVEEMSATLLTTLRFALMASPCLLLLTGRAWTRPKVG